MKIKQYITKKRALHLALFLLLAGAACIFDVYHEDSGEFMVETGTTDQTDQVVLYFCNPSATISLKAPGQKLPLRSLLQANNSRFIILHHSLRTFHILKAELPDHTECLLVRNLVSLRKCHFTAPDDFPPSV